LKTQRDGENLLKVTWRGKKNGQRRGGKRDENMTPGEVRSSKRKRREGGAGEDKTGQGGSAARRKNTIVTEKEEREEQGDVGVRGVSGAPKASRENAVGTTAGEKEDWERGGEPTTGKGPPWGESGSALEKTPLARTAIRRTWGGEEIMENSRRRNSSKKQLILKEKYR